MIALAVGWLEYCSAEAVNNNSSAGFTPSTGDNRLTFSVPVVMVPVLSKINALMRAANSMSLTCLIMMPNRDAVATAATIAVGVAKINATGLDTMNTEITRFKS